MLKTIFNTRHKELKATMVEFGGWEMPVQYDGGVIQEHLACRKHCGLFDVSHMGRFIIDGADALPFLQHVLTNNADALEIGESQYTTISDENGYALDDAYLYRFVDGEYLLVVNASNREKDWGHLRAVAELFDNLRLTDRTDEMAMLSLQGPNAKQILTSLITKGELPMPMRNKLSRVSVGAAPISLARTGYTGDPLGFELFMDAKDGIAIWDTLTQKGACPVGLGARDTLRLEACLPLYGHEFGLDSDGRPIPIFACPLARFAVSFSPRKGDFIGREALARQFECLKRILDGDTENNDALPRIIVPVAVSGKGIARQGCPVSRKGRQVGYVTSGTMVPYWDTLGDGLFSRFSETIEKRAIAMALVDADVVQGNILEIQIRKRTVEAVVVPYHMRAEAPPHARAIRWDRLGGELCVSAEDRSAEEKMANIIQKAIDNTRWRGRECINLIPSEQTASAFSRMLSIMDPAGRYAEHKKVKAFHDHDVFYYQGTGFIREVELLLNREIMTFLGCRNVESRVVSGQMANTAVFSALVDYLNRADRKREQRRIRKIMNNHILGGGHLSAQPMGALRDFVARDPQTERPAVVSFPTCVDNPYKIDVDACEELIQRHKPELIILGKSMTIYPEPVARIRGMVDEAGIKTTLMYDMAHVLGLAGPHFQEPFKEGADLVTGSTHKTFFGTQRGIVAGNTVPDSPEYLLWEAIERRAFPGSVSNHHLGTMLGLLAAAYEMNHFKGSYQRQVLANARAFAKALADLGVDVAGEAADGYTHTHQVIVHVGYANGPAVADRLEQNNIIVNYQATPEDEGFTASGALRMGVSEMTRFGMQEADFQELAQLLCDAVQGNANVKQAVTDLRQKFVRMQYCFDDDARLDGLLDQLYRLL